MGDTKTYSLHYVMRIFHLKLLRKPVRPLQPGSMVNLCKWYINGTLCAIYSTHSNPQSLATAGGGGRI